MPRKYANEGLTAVEVPESDRPLYKVFRPAPAAYSSHLIINQDSHPTLPLPLNPNLANKKYHKRNRKVNEQAALDRLLAPQFTSTAAQPRYLTEENVDDRRDSFNGVARTSPRPSADLVRRASGKYSQRSGNSGNASADRRDEPDVAQESRLRHRFSAYNRRRKGDRGVAANDEDDEEQLTSKALGVYIDQNGHVHDTEYDPFETVRTLSKKRFEKASRTAFGVSKDDDSEVGSDLSTSNLGNNSRSNSRDEDWTYQRSVSQSQLQRNKSAASSKYYDAQDGDEEAVAVEQHPLSPEAGPGPASAAALTSPVSNRTRSNTAWSEYDSGYSATSPRFGPQAQVSKSKLEVYDDGEVITIHPSSLHSRVQQLSVKEQPQSRPGSIRQSAYNKSTTALGTSAKTTQTSALARDEERPRSLLYPQTPAQIAAQKEKAAKRGVIEPMSPPIAPFHPSYPVKRGSGSSIASDSVSRNPLTGPSAKPASTVFSSHDMAYLPSRWAAGDHELRKGEEAIEKYRPLEWQGSQKPANEPDWSPGCMDVLVRNWHEFTLSFRFSAHRSKKKIGRKIVNM